MTLNRLHSFEPHGRCFAEAGSGAIAAMMAGSGPDEERERSGLRGKRVLIVEDEAVLAMDIAFTFEDEGADVVGPCHTLDEALSVLEGDIVEIDAAVLDVHVHGREVFPVARRLRDAGVPFLFHTGQATFEELSELFPGATVCTKPIMPEDLAARVAGLVGRRR